MTVYVYRDGKVVDKATLSYEGGSNAPFIIRDEMPALRHMATGKMHTSKAKFRADTKASGCVEIGTDTKYLLSRKPVKLDRRQRRDDIKRAIYEVRNGINR